MARTCRGQYATTSKPPTHTLLLHPTDDDDDDDPNSPHHYEEPDFPTHPTESSTALHHTPHNPDLPPVLWIHENHRLVWKLLKLLEASPDLRRGIWRKPGERSHGETKINIFRQLARLLLQDEIGFPDKELEGHYGKAVKAKVWNLEVLFEKKVQEMGPERVDRVEDLVPGSLAEGAWGIVKIDCPFFFLLQELCADRDRKDERQGRRVKEPAEAGEEGAAHEMQILEEQRAAGRKRRAITTAAISATTPFTELRNGIKRAKMVSTVASQDTTAAAVAPVSTVPELETTAFSVVLRGGMFEGKPPRGDYKYVAAWANLLRWVRGYMTGAFAMEVRYRALTRDAETLMVLGVKKEGDEVRDPVYNQSSYNAALQSAVGLRRKDAVLVFVQIWVIPEREVEVGEEA